jgi:hypothetical protein
MKKIYFLFFLFCTTLCFSQGAIKDSAKTDYKNVIAIDINPLLSQLLNVNQSNNYYYYSSPYVLAYRRIIKNSAIKFAIGGQTETSDEKRNDSLKFTSERSQLSLALGFEHYTYLSKRWTAFFGVDLTNSYSTNNGKYSWSTTSYMDDEDKTTSYGIAPVLGIVFKITKRMSVSTQTSYNFSYVNTISSRKQVPNPQYNETRNSKGFQTGFIAPTSVSFRLKF